MWKNRMMVVADAFPPGMLGYLSFAETLALSRLPYAVLCRLMNFGGHNFLFGFMFASIRWRFVYMCLDVL
jgi:hypothetical protein